MKKTQHFRLVDGSINKQGTYMACLGGQWDG